MRVFAVNSSPRMESGNTAVVLDAFLSGMRSAGAEVDLYYTKKLRIAPCSGEFDCWEKPGASCRIRDDMDVVLSVMRKAETWVLGIPLYVPLPGEMQNLLNRTMPLMTSAVRVRGERMYPKRRPELKLKRIVPVSTCSFWEMDNFDYLLNTIDTVCTIFDVKMVGPVLRPHADTLRGASKTDKARIAVIDAARAAGRECAEKGDISSRTLKTISAPLISRKDYLTKMER